MLHRLKQNDSGDWEIDTYTLKKEWVENVHNPVFSSEYYIGRDSAGEQITDTHTTFEDCLSELIWYIEDKYILEEKDE